MGVRILHLAATTWKPRWTARCRCCWAGESFDYGGAGPGRAQGARSSDAGPGKPDLKIYDRLLTSLVRGGVRIVMQDRIGQLCGLKLLGPSRGSFHRAGHGDAGWRTGQTYILGRDRGEGHLQSAGRRHRQTVQRALAPWRTSLPAALGQGYLRYFGSSIKGEAT